LLFGLKRDLRFLFSFDIVADVRAQVPHCRTNPARALPDRLAEPSILVS
jgi:hypothetical protein